MHERVGHVCADLNVRARIHNRPVLWSSLFLIKFDLIAIAKQNAIIDLTNVCSVTAVLAVVPLFRCRCTILTFRTRIHFVVVRYKLDATGKSGRRD